MRPDVLTEVTLVLTDAAERELVALPSRLVHHIQMKPVVLTVRIVALPIPVRERVVRAA